MITTLTLSVHAEIQPGVLSTRCKASKDDQDSGRRPRVQIGLDPDQRRGSPERPRNTSNRLPDPGRPASAGLRTDGAVSRPGRSGLPLLGIGVTNARIASKVQR